MLQSIWQQFRVYKLIYLILHLCQNTDINWRHMLMRRQLKIEMHVTLQFLFSNTYPQGREILKRCSITISNPFSDDSNLSCTEIIIFQFPANFLRETSLGTISKSLQLSNTVFTCTLHMQCNSTFYSKKSKVRAVKLVLSAGFSDNTTSLRGESYHQTRCVLQYSTLYYEKS